MITTQEQGSKMSSEPKSIVKALETYGRELTCRAALHAEALSFERSPRHEKRLKYLSLRICGISSVAIVTENLILPNFGLE